MTISHINRTFLFIAAGITAVSAAFLLEKPLGEREKFSRFLSSHPYNRHEVREENETGEADRDLTDRPDLAAEQDFLRTMNPTLGRPTPENLLPIMQQVKTGLSYKSSPGSVTSPWVERGPNNVGGRTRTLVWDPNDATGKKVWAGSVTGGLWYNNDILSSTSSWNSVNDFWANITVTCMAFDPNNAQIAYVGTGESFTGSGLGAGIWKTTDGGTTWNQVSSTTGFYFVNDIAVRNESGNSVVYAAVDSRSYKGTFWGTADAGLRRSINGGTSWTQVMPLVSGQPHVPSDIELGANNRIWIGTKSNPYGNGGGKVMYSDNGTTWTISSASAVSTGYGRVEIACAPSNASVVYALVEDQTAIYKILKTTNGGSAWADMTTSSPVDDDPSIPFDDFTRGQASYDLILAVDPNNENTLLMGGIDLFSSTDGASTWTQISMWYSGTGYQYVHADQHAITYKPGSSNTVLFGNDGGVFYSANGGGNIVARNTAYDVTQFYACAMHPAANSNHFLAGAQDNGTHRFSTTGINSTTSIRGGDGAFCFVDQVSPNYQIASYVYNTYYLSTNGGSSQFNTQLVADQSTGRFINPSGYDNNMHILYACRDAASLTRIKNITGSPSAGSVSITALGNYASHIRVSPYTTTSSTLFVGTESGKLFKVTNADNTPVATNITGSSFPSGSISCVEIGASENELLVTFFNYGVTSVWYTSDGGASWVSKEGNLPDMPVRWALFNPNNRTEVILATELGVWATNSLNSSSPTWASSSSGLANVRVDMLQLRTSDYTVIAATYGRGLFSSTGFSTYLTSAYFKTSNKVPCVNETVDLTDTCLTPTTASSWVISPSTYTFIGGTSASSKNPQVQFTAPGTYNITLTVTNSGGTFTTVKNNYITVDGFALPYTENWETPANYANWTIDNPDASIGWGIYTTGGNTPGTLSAGIYNRNYVAAASAILRDGLISPPIRLAGYSAATLTFKHAYRRVSVSVQDSMAVYVSTNCGSTWTRVAGYKETQTTSPYVYITTSNTTTSFTPSSSSQWCGSSGYSPCKSIDLTPYAGSVIRIKFENISGNGNSLFIDDINVTGVSNMSPPVAAFNASTVNACSGSAVTFTDSTTNSPHAWTWTFTPSTVTYLNGTGPNSQNPVVSFQGSGNYSVSLTATNTKSSNTLNKTNYISVTSSITPSITVSPSANNVCAGSGVIFTSGIFNGGSSPAYQWRVNGIIAGTGNSFSSTTLNNNDTVTCELTNNETCVIPASVVSNPVAMIIKPAPVIPVVTQSGTTLSCSVSGMSYQWYKNGSALLGATSQTYTFSATATYKVRITNSSSCSSTSADFNAFNPGVDEAALLSGFRLFPNPSKDIFRMEFTLSQAKQVRFKVYDLGGKIVFETVETFTSGMNSFALKLGHLPQGQYLLQMTDCSTRMHRSLFRE